MIIPDVNVWIDALRPDAPHHREVRTWLEHAVVAPEPLGVSELVLSGVMRVLTHPRLGRAPYDTVEVLDELESFRRARGSVPVRAGVRHWEIFSGLCRRTGVVGNDIPDAYHAALAMEHDAVLVSSDRGFEKFNGLKYRHPLD